MAHNLNIDNGQASFMFVGEPAWHSLGTKLDSPPTAAEAIAAAGLSWTVKKVPLLATEVNRSMEVPNKFAVVREDKWGQPDCEVLGIVGDGYTPLQNIKAFDFFDAIVKKKDAAIYHTAGALGNGERVWILAKLPKEIRVVGDDIAEKYLLLSNSHDGQSSVQVRFTPIRVVCQNTLTMALQEAGQTIRVPHKRDLHHRLKDVERLLGIVNTRFDDIEATFKEMARTKIDTERLNQYISAIFPLPRDQEDEKARIRVEKNREAAVHLFESGRGNAVAGVSGTLWAAYNGIAEYIDFRPVSIVRGRQSPESMRVSNMWFGDGYLTKAKAYKVAKDKLEAWLN